MTFLIKGVKTIAKKRLKKKQQAKKNIELLKSVGIENKRQIKELKNKPKEVNKVYKKESRNILARNRYGELTNRYNISHKEAMKMRYWGEKRYNEFIFSKEKEIEKKRKKEIQKTVQKERELNSNYLLIFWKEKTDTDLPDDLISEYKEAYRSASIDWLIQSIQGFLTQKLPSAIGTTQISVVKGKDRQNYKKFMRAYDTGMLSDWNSWILAYEGKAQRYKDLLLAVHAVIRNLYDPTEKAEFLGNLISKYLPQVNMNTAKRLAKDLRWRGF